MKFTRTLILAAALVCGLFLATPNFATAGPNPVVIMETSMGRVIVMLYPRDAPETVENFLKYVDAGFYDKTLFHRVILQKQKAVKMGSAAKADGSMNIVQGGGFDVSMHKKRALFPPIKNEAASALLNKEGTISMARTSAPDSATSEFFFNVKDNPTFDYAQSASQSGAGRYSSNTKAGYCAFGKVIRGMDVIEKIQQVKTISKGRMDDVPAKPVILKKVYRAK